MSDPLPSINLSELCVLGSAALEDLRTEFISSSSFEFEENSERAHKFNTFLARLTAYSSVLPNESRGRQAVLALLDRSVITRQSFPIQRNMPLPSYSPLLVTPGDLQEIFISWLCLAFDPCVLFPGMMPRNLETMFTPSLPQYPSLVPAFFCVYDSRCGRQVQHVIIQILRQRLNRSPSSDEVFCALANAWKDEGLLDRVKLKAVLMDYSLGHNMTVVAFYTSGSVALAGPSSQYVWTLRLRVDYTERFLTLREMGANYPGGLLTFRNSGLWEYLRIGYENDVVRAQMAEDDGPGVSYLFKPTPG